MTINTLLFGFNLPPARVNICSNPVLRAAAPANIRHCGEPAAGAEKHFSFSGCGLWSGSFNISLQLCHAGSQWCEMNEWWWWWWCWCVSMKYIFCCTGNVSVDGMCFFFKAQVLLQNKSGSSLFSFTYSWAASWCSSVIELQAVSSSDRILPVSITPAGAGGGGGGGELGSGLCLLDPAVGEDFNQVSRPVELFLESFASWCSQSPLCQKDSVPPVVRRKSWRFRFKEALLFFNSRCDTPAVRHCNKWTSSL